MHMDMGIQGPGLACGRAATGLATTVLSRMAVANVAREMGMRLLSRGLGKPWCRINHGLLFLPRSLGIE